MRKKRKLAKEKGAVGLIELYRLQFPWQFFLSYFGKESLNLADKMETTKSNPNFVYGWIKEENKETFNAMKDSKKTKVELSSEGFSRRAVTSNNVIGLLEGTDPELKDEYLLITAHFDHVGTGKNGGSPYTPEDSIFNGARDNAMGTTALLGALQALAEAPPKRSVIFLAVTGEEIGLLGSQYYAENPLLPMDQVIFNLNTDGAGYNDPSYVSIVGFGRTGTDGLVEAASNIFGLDVFPNPAPEQNLFDRSDNVSFAKLGVPALCFSPGLTEFDEEISTYYHQAADNPDSIDFDYLQKFCQALARTARLIADDEDRPFWVEGDKYEEAGKQLYER
jgi:Zn-dependent M28 family amino/carboxypeptidase